MLGPNFTMNSLKAINPRSSSPHTAMFQSNEIQLPQRNTIEFIQSGEGRTHNNDADVDFLSTTSGDLEQLFMPHLEVYFPCLSTQQAA